MRNGFLLFWTESFYKRTFWYDLSSWNPTSVFGYLKSFTVLLFKDGKMIPSIYAVSVDQHGLEVKSTPPTQTRIEMLLGRNTPETKWCSRHPNGRSWEHQPCLTNQAMKKKEYRIAFGDHSETNAKRNGSSETNAKRNGSSYMSDFTWFPFWCFWVLFWILV